MFATALPIEFHYFDFVKLEMNWSGKIYSYILAATFLIFFKSIPLNQYGITTKQKEGSINFSVRTTIAFIFVMLAITAFLLVYSDKKIKQRSLIDKKVAEELNTPLTIFFDKIYYVIVFVPFIFPILYYNTNLISIDFVLFWVLASPWIWCAVSFTNFSKLLHHALRIVKEDKLETAGNG